MKITFGQKALLAAALFAAQPWNTSADVAYIISAPNPGDFVGNAGAGQYLLQFTVGSSPLQVTDLGVFDSGQDGLAGNVPVALLDSSLAPVTPGFSIGPSGDDTGTLLPGSAYRYAALPSPVILAANTTYSIYAQYSAAGPSYDAGVGPTAVLLGNTSMAHNDSLFFDGITWNSGGGAQPQYGAGGFLFTVVPESSHCALIGVGFLAIICAGRSVWLRRKTA